MERRWLVHVSTSAGSYDLEATVQPVGPDWLVLIWGGDKPHIGAVAVAQPRPSLEDEDVVSATASVFCFLGHKDDVLAKEASERLAAILDANVVVAAGVHWDGIETAGIQKVIENNRVLIGLIEEKIQRIRRES